MPTPSEILDAAGKAKREGREEDFRVLMRLYRSKVDVLPEVPRGEPELPPFESQSLVQARMERMIQDRYEKIVAEEGGFSRGEEARRREEERFRAQARSEVEREFPQIAMAGEGPRPSPGRGMLPMFRPSRIVVDPETGETLYRDPTISPIDPETQRRDPSRQLREPKGFDVPLYRILAEEDRLPTVSEALGGVLYPVRPPEELVESFAAQQQFTEEEAQRMTEGELEEAVGVFAGTSPTATGIYESPLVATARGALGAMEAVVGEGFIRPLTYEISPETAERARDKRMEAQEALANNQMEDFFRLSGEAEEILLEDPLDPTDYAYKLGKMRDWIGLPSTFYHPTLKGVAIPMPFTASVATTRPEYEGLPGSEARRASDIEVPSPFEDFEGFMEAESLRLARNISAGRGLGDEFRDLPGLTNYYEAVWGDPNIAYWQGLAGSLFVPLTPAGLKVGRNLSGFAREVAAGTRAEGAAARVVEASTKAATDAGRAAAQAAAEAASRAATSDLARSIANLATDAKVPVPLMREGYNAALGAAMRVAETTNQNMNKVYALVRPGAKSDEIIIRNVARKVLARYGVADEIVETAIKAIRAGVRTADEAAADIQKGVGAAIPVEQMESIRSAMRLFTPGDFVMITDDIAAPRAIAEDLRAAADRYARNQIKRDAGNQASFLLREQTRLSRFLDGKLNEQIARTVAALDAGSPAAEKAALNLLARMANAAKLDAVATKNLLNRFRTKPLSEIKAGLPEELREGIPVNVSRFADLSTEDKRKLVQALQSQYIRINAGGVARAKWELTTMQIALDKSLVSTTNLFDKPWFNRPFSRRFVALFGNKLDDTTKMYVDAAFVVSRMSRERGRVVTKMLTDRARELQQAMPEVVKEKGTVNAALDSLVESEARGLGISSEDMWDKIFEVMFNPDLDREALVRFLSNPRGNLFKLIEDYPTVDAVNRVAVAAQNNAAIRWAGWTTPWSSDAQKYMLAMLLQGPIMEKTALRAVAGEMARVMPMMDYHVYAMKEGMTLTPRELIFNPEVGEALAETSRLYDTMFPSVNPFMMTRMVPGLDTQFAQAIMAGGGEFINVLNYVPPAFRKEFLRVWETALEKAAAGYVGIHQAAKYGYVVPNLIGMAYRGLERPFIAASQVGVDTALRGALRAVGKTSVGQYAQRIKNMILQRNMTGGGITTPTGAYYTPADLLKLAEQEGIGFTSVQSERVGLLMMDILTDVNRTLKGRGKKLFDEINPVTKTFWTRTAEAMERSFRHGVFEARLAAGDTVAEAGRAARRSQFDYSEIPDLLRQGRLAELFVGAQTTYKLSVEMARLALSNPKLLTKYFRTLEAMHKIQDPYGVGGDQSLLNLKVTVGEGDSYLLRVPGAGVAEHVVVLARHGDNAFRSMFAAWEAYQKGRGVGGAISEVGLLSGVPIVYSAVDVALGPVFAAWATSEDVDPYPTAGADREVSDEKMWWAAALVALNNDPMQKGLWNDFVRHFGPKRIPPPPEREHPELPGYWKDRPEGMPYLFLGRTAPTEAHPAGRPIFEAVEMSDTAQQNMAVLRALTPDNLTRFFPVYAAMGGDTAYGQPRYLRDIERIEAGQFIDDNGLQEALGLFLDPAGIDYSNPQEEQTRQALEYLRTRATRTETPE